LYVHHPDLPSFPTRRSSDLLPTVPMRVLWVSFALLLLDQATKQLVHAAMVPGQSIPLVGDLLKLTYTTNPGMAFGLTLGSKLFRSEEHTSELQSRENLVCRL